MENSSGQTNPNLVPLPLLQPPYLVLPPYRGWPARIKNWRDLSSEHRKRKNWSQASCAPALTRRGWRHSPTPHSDKKQLVQRNRNCLDGLGHVGNNMLKEICYQNKDGARRDMLPEGICCLRRYVTRGDTMLKVSSQGVSSQGVSSQGVSGHRSNPSLSAKSVSLDFSYLFLHFVSF